MKDLFVENRKLNILGLIRTSTYEDIHLSEEEMSLNIENFLLKLNCEKPLFISDKNNNYKLKEGKEYISLDKFMNNDFKLSNLKFLTELEGLFFKDIPGREYNILNSLELDVIVVYSENTDLIKKI